MGTGAANILKESATFEPRGCTSGKKARAASRCHLHSGSGGTDTAVLLACARVRKACLRARHFHNLLRGELTAVLFGIGIFACGDCTSSNKKPLARGEDSPHVVPSGAVTTSDLRSS